MIPSQVVKKMLNTLKEIQEQNARIEAKLDTALGITSTTAVVSKAKSKSKTKPTAETPEAGEEVIVSEGEEYGES